MKHLSTTIFIVTIFTVNRKSFLLQLLFNSVYHSFVIVKISRIYYILGVSSRMGSASFLFLFLIFPEIHCLSGYAGFFCCQSYEVACHRDLSAGFSTGCIA